MNKALFKRLDSRIRKYLTKLRNERADFIIDLTPVQC